MKTNLIYSKNQKTALSAIMNIAAIQTFLTVMRTGNLNRAAEQLNVTQSAVSARLDTLEQALGAKLLVRPR